ncbi:MAG: Rne/Rng family ribonuclease [Rickettsiales bacterium]|jgi:ribonuclease E|nr:Rne/Rng family ribonuclease [Rickettsiales bacterium]
MSKKILIDAVYPGETRVVVHDQNNIQEFDYENSHKKQLKGNIYLARITRIEPSLQAAFIEYGGNRHGFLPFAEIHPDYFLESTEGSFEQEKTGAAIKDKIAAINLPEVNEEETIPESLTTERPIEESKAEELVLDSALEDNVINEEASEEPRQTIHQKYKIQDVLRKGQVILVQILKEERGNKGAACTSYISLAGRYCVFMPNSDKQGGVSRRIVNQGDRNYLRDVISNLKLQDGVSIILRTAGAGKSFSDIRRDYYYLARLWNAIREHAIKSKVNTFIHAESDLLKRTIRDLYSSEIDEILIQGTESFKAAKEFMKKIMPLHAQKVREYKARTPIFTKFNVDEQISSLYSPTANLPSGGYIVINPTEALIAIDVNSGRATNERNIEETATKTNTEAAIEVARQLRLRDMSGLIVIDFIDMAGANNRKTVELALRDAFQEDRAKVQLGNISAFGLLELSRQRLQSSFTEANTVVCPACTGKGYIKSFDSNALVILRTIENEVYQGDCSVVDVFTHQEMIEHLLNYKREELIRIEKTHKCKVVFHRENTVYYDGFAIEKTEKDKNSNKANSKPKLSDEEHMASYETDTFEDNILLQEKQLGLGDNLAPYQVNDHSIIDENAPMAARHRVHKSGHNSKRRKTSNAPDSDRPHINNKRRPGGNRYRNNRNRQNSGNRKPESKSVLKGWWDKLTK